MIPVTCVYLCGPIFGQSTAFCVSWRENASLVLGEVRDPMTRDYRGKEDANIQDIVEHDKKDIDECSHVLAYVPKPSIGTAMEILYAWERNKPVIAVVPEGPVSPWLQYHARIVRDFASAYELLK